MPVKIASARDVHEFVAAKRNKGEPIVLTGGPAIAEAKQMLDRISTEQGAPCVPVKLKGKAEASATLRPHSEAHWAGFLLRLRENPSFGRACEFVEALHRAFRARHHCTPPIPSEVTQQADGSLALHYTPDGGTLTILAHPAGLAGLIGGTQGRVEQGCTPVLLDALRFVLVGRTP